MNGCQGNEGGERSQEGGKTGSGEGGGSEGLLVAVKGRVVRAAGLGATSDGLGACHERRCSTDHGTSTSASSLVLANANVVGLTHGEGGSGDVVSLSIACLVRRGNGL